MGTKWHRTLEERFWAKVDKTGDNGCWLWTAGTNGRYGKMKENRVSVYAHRLSVMFDGRDIPEGMEIDHLCHTTLCVNPAHLEVVTPEVNAQRKIRGRYRAARGSVRTRCRAGHEMTKDNVFKKKGESYRRCRKCHKRMVRLNWLAKLSKKQTEEAKHGCN